MGHFALSFCAVCLALQLCLSLCDSMDGNPPGSSVRGISEARTLEWVAISFSRGSCQPSVSCVSCIAGRFFTHWAVLNTISLSNLTSFSAGAQFVLDSQRTINCKKYFNSTTQISSSIDWMFLYSLKFICWNLIFFVVVLGGRTFEGWLGPEGKALVNRISAIIKGAPESSLPALWAHKEKRTVYEPERGTGIASAWTLGLPPSSIVRNKFLSLIKHLISGVLW